MDEQNAAGLEKIGAYLFRLSGNVVWWGGLG
jgi:hypothetical protein